MNPGNIPSPVSYTHLDVYKRQTYAIMAMKAGKPAYIEKPMAVTYEECTRINRISKETGVPCFVHKDLLLVRHRKECNPAILI